MSCVVRLSEHAVCNDIASTEMSEAVDLGEKRPKRSVQVEPASEVITMCDDPLRAIGSRVVARKKVNEGRHVRWLRLYRR